jgi:hypothetical protein
LIAKYEGGGHQLVLLPSSNTSLKKPDPGKKYSFKSAQKKDYKSVSPESRELLGKYRQEVEKVLIEVKRSPAESTEALQAQVGNLKKQLQSIEAELS